MKKLICLSLISLLLVSCFKEEPSNSECDIIDAWVEGEELKAYFYNDADMRIENIPSGVKIHAEAKIIVAKDWRT